MEPDALVCHIESVYTCTDTDDAAAPAPALLPFGAAAFETETVVYIKQEDLENALQVVKEECDGEQLLVSNVHTIVKQEEEERFAAAAAPPPQIAAMIPPPPPPPMIPHRHRQQQVRRPVVYLMVLRNRRSTHYNLRRLCR